MNQQKTIVEDKDIEEDQSRSTNIDLEEEVNDFNYYMTLQDRNSARNAKPRGGVKVRGRFRRKPNGI